MPEEVIISAIDPGLAEKLHTQREANLAAAQAATEGGGDMPPPSAPEGGTKVVTIDIEVPREPTQDEIQACMYGALAFTRFCEVVLHFKPWTEPEIQRLAVVEARLAVDVVPGMLAYVGKHSRKLDFVFEHFNQMVDHWPEDKKDEKKGEKTGAEEAKPIPQKQG